MIRIGWFSTARPTCPALNCCYRSRSLRSLHGGVCLAREMQNAKNYWGCAFRHGHRAHGRGGVSKPSHECRSYDAVCDREFDNSVGSSWATFRISALTRCYRRLVCGVGERLRLGGCASVLSAERLFASDRLERFPSRAHLCDWRWSLLRWRFLQGLPASDMRLIVVLAVAVPTGFQI